MPYELRGNSVVKSNSGEVVKAHPTRAKALAHLRALKANVEEGAPAALGALLEGFNASERRGFHGRWVGTHAGKVLRVFHGDTSLGDVKPGESRTHTMIGVGRVVGEAGRTISTGDIAKVVDRAAGSSEPSPRVIAKGGSANELRGGIPRTRVVGGPQIAQAATAARSEREQIASKQAAFRAQSPAPGESRHGGFVVGDHVGYRTPSIVNGAVEGYGPPQVGTVSGLQRNGYLRVREPVHGTTVDVHHSHATPIPSSHFQKLTGSSSRERGVAQLQLEKLIKVPRPRIREAEACPDVLGSLLG